MRPCFTGEHQQTEAVCSASTYSSGPCDIPCDHCPANARCSAGATLVPGPAYWHSAVHSDWKVSCPNGEACQKCQDEVWNYKKALYDADVTQILVCLGSSLLWISSSVAGSSLLCGQYYVLKQQLLGCSGLAHCSLALGCPTQPCHALYLSCTTFRPGAETAALPCPALFLQSRCAPASCSMPRSALCRHPALANASRLCTQEQAVLHVTCALAHSTMLPLSADVVQHAL